MSSRLIFSNNPELNKQFKYSSNYQSTTKYSLLTFFPASLFNQFKRVANIYFLCIAILTTIPIISSLSPISAVAPLIFVLTVSMTREAIEDYLRYKSDKEINSSPVLIFNSTFTQQTYKDVQVGNVLLINKDEAFPADMILLTACNENGVAFIETSTLDGEKNLKNRNSLMATSGLDENSDWNKEYKVECELPNPKIYSFSGSVGVGNNVFPVDKNQLLLAGAFLRNTSKVIGMVIYTGKDTKLRQNLMAKGSKVSKVDSRVNKFVFVIIIIQCLLCVFASLGAYFFLENTKKDHKYIKGIDRSNIFQSVLTYFTYFLLLNTLLPISLIISLELLKSFQGYFMQNDLEMYSELRDRTCKVSSYSITEELGMIQHIFSDKTGTLTCNKMEFKFCTVGNKVYGDRRYLHDLDFVSNSSYTTREIIFTFDIKEMFNDVFSSHFAGQKLKWSLSELGINTQDALLNWFLRCMALCHECMIEYEDSGIKYVGQSPDEITLVDAARHIGIEYHKLHRNVITLLVRGLSGQPLEEHYERICVNEFDSDRKRNSVVVKDLRTGIIFLFVKGADNVIKARLSKRNSSEYVEKIDKDLTDYSNRGLRTLLLAMKVLQQSEFDLWKNEFDKASTSINNRQEKLNSLAETIEKDLFLLGCTAVEDALQAEVPATVRSILKAGIKLWMLTGDKLETAINIGKTCGLINTYTNVLICSESKLQTCFHTLNSLSSILTKQKQDLALVIEGSSLEIVLYDKTDSEKVAKYPEYSASEEVANTALRCRELFLQLAAKCDSVICCRVTPGQKREVVRLMKKEEKCVSLAIGDGANDVSMILEADVGVGIYGEEGMQAIQASDYGIGEFRFLWELLLVHGRFNYLRVSEMILYFFYKNIVFTLPQFFFAFFCGFSGNSVYDSWYITLYNTIFTAAPLMSKALFEKDVIVPKRIQVGCQEEAFIRGLVPMVYELGRENQVFTAGNFVIWFFSGIFHSFVVFFLPLYAVQAGIIDGDGHNADFWAFSICSFTCVVFVVNVKLAIHSRMWTGLHVFSIVGLSVFLYIVFMIAYDVYSPTSSRGSVIQIISTPYFYMIILTVIIFCFIFDGGLIAARRIIWPTKSEILMDYSLDYNFKKQCESTTHTFTQSYSGIN